MYKIIKAFDKDEPIVAMVNYNGFILVATAKRVFILVEDCFVPVQFSEPENE